jgi:hypothetical protein
LPKSVINYKTKLVRNESDKQVANSPFANNASELRHKDDPMDQEMFALALACEGMVSQGRLTLTIMEAELKEDVSYFSMDPYLTLTYRGSKN